jgi:hypothetical protein
MYRLWLWPLGLSPIFIVPWVATMYNIPIETFLAPIGLIWAPIIHAIDRKYAIKNNPEIETELPYLGHPGNVKLNSTSQKILGWFALIVGILLVAFGTNDNGNKLPSIITAFFFILIAGACLLPKNIKGYFGDIIALSVILSAIWFFVTPLKDDNANPAMFAYIFGVGAVIYLFKRYKNRSPKAEPEYFNRYKRRFKKTK